MESMARIEGSTSQTLNDLLYEYVEKSVDFELAKELSMQSAANLRQREADLLEEKKNLNELHLQIFRMENELYESIWKFSAQHDFTSILERYLNTPRLILCHQADKNLIQTFRRLLDEVRTLTLDFEVMQADLKQRISWHRSSKRIKRDIPDTLIDATMNFETPECPKIKKSSKFSVKTKSAITRRFEKS